MWNVYTPSEFKWLAPNGSQGHQRTLVLSLLLLPGRPTPFSQYLCLHSQVIIITNSDEGWVKYSAEKYCPPLLPVIKKYRVVSARTRYEKFYPGQPLCWKAAAFAHEVNEIYEKLKDDSSSIASLEGTDVSSNSSLESMEEDERRQIISFGDSSEERTAVNIVSGQLDAVPKSVMFMHSPSPAQIIGQLHMLTNHMDYVCHGSASLDLQISAEQADRFARTYLQRDNDAVSAQA